ncbi:hypothetical protein ROHU_026414 [Labeo rohita]|uniref:Uncharacterized protein n=1 Tax=Labeo rohita TaxID=84645 RepID=A0A498MDI5_LABRO|nr:hypothetical protein ROHU_026414 [Labeo rohita]
MGPADRSPARGEPGPRFGPRPSPDCRWAVVVQMSVGDDFVPSVSFCNTGGGGQTQALEYLTTGPRLPLL